MTLDHVVLVTGANRAIGLEVCRQLAGLGQTAGRTYLARRLQRSEPISVVLD